MVIMVSCGLSLGIFGGGYWRKSDKGNEESDKGNEESEDAHLTDML